MRIDQIAILEHRKRLFWLFQFLFWSAHSALYVFNHPKVLSYFSNIHPHVTSILIAFGLSMGLRYVYRTYHCYQFSPGPLITIVLLYSTFAGTTNAWFDRIIGYVNFGDAYPLHFLTGSGLVNLVWRYSYTFVAWSALYIGFTIYEEWMVANQKAERAETLAQSAQLAMLRYQLNPHFFFNSLSSVLSLISRDPKKAEQILIKISEFMRYSLLAGKQQLVPLSEEIEIIRHYLDIEKVRYSDKLEATLGDVLAAEDYPVPVLLLHSLVENAVKHGIETSPLPLRIAVRGKRVGRSLELEIENTGRWIEPAQANGKAGTGTGLENTRRRLEHFYPRKHSFEILKGNETVCVRIILKDYPDESTL